MSDIQAICFTPDSTDPGTPPDGALPTIRYAGKDCNLFIGTVTQSSTTGSMAMWIDNHEEWEDLWQRAGRGAPGPLPEGACAHFEQRFTDDKHIDMSLRSFDAATQVFTWQVTTKTLEEDEEARGFWLICLAPKEANHHKYSYLNVPSAGELLATIQAEAQAQLQQSQENYERFAGKIKPAAPRFRL